MGVPLEAWQHRMSGRGRPGPYFALEGWRGHGKGGGQDRCRGSILRTTPRTNTSCAEDANIAGPPWPAVEISTASAHGL